jgi:hypothetical protein
MKTLNSRGWAGKMGAGWVWAQESSFSLLRQVSLCSPLPPECWDCHHTHICLFFEDVEVVWGVESKPCYSRQKHTGDSRTGTH